MKPFYLGTLLGVLSLAGCGAPSQQVLRLEKSPLPLGGKMAVYMESNPHRPWDALYPVVRGVPDSWRDATVYYAETDLPQLLYQGYRQGLADEKFCMGYFNVWGLDTASRSARPIRSVIAMAAGVTAEGRPAYLFDTDGDDDLSDETVRYFGADSVAVEVTPVYVERYGGGGVVLPDSAYVYPACRNSDMLLYCAECCSGEAAVAGGRYAVTVKPYVRNYDADSAEIVFSDGDTTLRHRVGEFVRLGGSYYRIDSLRPDGQAIDLDAMPVCYAVTYIFGTAGSAWILGTLGPRLLGGVEKVHKAALDLESKLGDDVSFTAGFDPAARAIVFRAYKAENDWFGQRHTVAEFERYMQSQKKLIFVERLRQRGRIVDDVTPRTTIYPGDTLVVSGRRQYVIEEEDWIGTEVEDAELTNFSVQSLPVVVSKRGAAGQYVRNILKRKEMHGVNIRSILRAGVKIPVLAGGKLDAGDRLELVGLPQDVRRAAPTLGFSDPVSEKTGMPLVGLGIFLGGLLFGWLLMTRIGAVPLSLTVSGGVLIAGLFCGWLHARYPHVGNIPQPTLWFMNNVGLNTFIAIVGISTGPTFIQGFQEVGWSLFLIGAAATSIPLVAGIFIGRYLFRFNDALTLGCVAGARTTTAALGAVEETIQSNVPSMGYTITYAIGNTLLIIWGVVIVLLIA